MTLKDFLKAWRECSKTHKNGDLRRDKECEDCCENEGVNQADLNEMIDEIQMDKEQKWWNEELFEYLLERAENGDKNALEIKAKFRLDELNFGELKRLLNSAEFISRLDEFWQSSI